MENNQQHRRRERVSTSSVVATVAVAYSAYQLGSWVWNQYHEGIRTEPEDWKKRRIRLLNCRMDVRQTLIRFLPSVRTIIEERIPTKELTHALKALRGTTGRQEEQDELWDTLRIQILTRLLVSVYAYTLLTLVLTVQVHFLASRQQEEDASDHQRALRETYEYFFTSGIVSLIRTVERAVSECGDINVRLVLSKQDVETMFRLIRQQVEGTRRKRSLLRFFKSPAAHGLMDDTLSIFDEIWDVLESPVMKDAEGDALGYVFDEMKDHGWGTVFVESATSKPLASIIPLFKHSANKFLEENEEAHELVKGIQDLATVLELADVSYTPYNKK